MHRRRKSRALIGRPLAALALSLGGLVLASAFLGVTVQANALARGIATTQGEIFAEASRHAELEMQIAQQHTADYVVRKARDYGYIGPNEALIAVEPTPQTQPQAQQASVRARVERWAEFFFGRR